MCAWNNPAIKLVDDDGFAFRFTTSFPGIISCNFLVIVISHTRVFWDETNENHHMDFARDGVALATADRHYNNPL